MRLRWSTWPTWIALAAFVSCGSLLWSAAPQGGKKGQKQPAKQARKSPPKAAAAPEENLTVRIDGGYMELYEPEIGLSLKCKNGVMKKHEDTQILHAQAWGNELIEVKILSKGNMQAYCTDLKFSTDGGRHVLSGRARIIQKDDSGKETFTVSGDKIVIEETGEDLMKIIVTKARQPGAPRVRLKTKGESK
jgi:hypothetical protein